MWALCSFCFSAQIDAIYHMITGPEWRPTDNCRFSGLVLFPLWIPSSINKKIVSPNQPPNQVHGLSVPSLILYGLTYVVKKGVYCTSSDQHSPDHLNQGSVGYKYLKPFQSRPQVLSTCCSLFSKHFSQMSTWLNSSFISCLCSDFPFSGWLLQPHYLTTATHTSSHPTPFPAFIFPLHLSFSCPISHLSYLLFLTLPHLHPISSGIQSPRRAEICLFFFFSVFATQP